MKKLSGKQKKCASCRELFTPERTLQKTCSGLCALSWVNTQQEKKRKAETTKRKKALLDNCPKHWSKKAKDACHAYIKERDRLLPCVSCGTTDNVQYAAGHYRPSGVNSSLRYDDRNIHKQCNRYCNMALSGNLIKYRAEIVRRLGVDTVEWLDNHHEVKKWTVQDLKNIHAHYVEKLRLLKSTDNRD